MALIISKDNSTIIHVKASEYDHRDIEYFTFSQETYVKVTKVIVLSNQQGWSKHEVYSCGERVRLDTTVSGQPHRLA